MEAELKRKIIRPFADRFFAGETLKEAVAHTKEANALGVGVTLDYLGEDVADVTEAEAAVEEYGHVLDAIAENYLDCSLALKMTHIGLCVDEGYALSALKEIGGLAGRMGIRIWLDMEGSQYTNRVLEAYRMLRRVNPDSGVALQASLWRTWEDLTALVAEGALIRLVKGAYREPSTVAVRRPSEIRARYIEMMEYLFASSKSFAIGTHDMRIIKTALGAARDVDTEVEFQMLMGMRDELKLDLAGSGVRVVEYVPYGEDWYGYGMRRLKETRRNVIRMAEGLVGR